MSQLTFATGDCEVLTGYEKYNCQIATHCKKYKPKHITFKTKAFEENIQTTGEDVDIYTQSKQRYRENQNGIYSCSIVKIQQNSLKTVKEKLLKIDKSGTLSSTLKKKIELKITKLKTLSKQKECKITDKKSIYSKRDLLIESSYQLCDYSFYLEYTKEHYTNIANSLNINVDEIEDQSYGISYIARQQASIQEDIEKERLHTHKIFHLAFQSYIDYENNLPVHILLELIKQDFIVYRQKLHQTLSPLNQVVYKIANAMSIH
ncbi:hypothetical protein LR004_02430 [Candidatus Gracilibacteria bacterium]|nr:hypothetical protein [Candidatus Gracilibacteria bacterium]